VITRAEHHRVGLALRLLLMFHALRATHGQPPSTCIGSRLPSYRPRDAGSLVDADSD
jgi:hypothetical protein